MEHLHLRRNERKMKPHIIRSVAADTLEYGVADANGDEDIEWFPVDATVGTAEDARLAAVNYAASDQFFRLVARRVSAPWEVKE